MSLSSLGLSSPFSRLSLLSRPPLIPLRSFSASAPALAKHSKRALQHLLRNVPPYPHAIQHHYKRSWFGLYGGARIQFGNNVPDSRHKTRRHWHPNVRANKKIYSEALGDFVRIDVTARVLRTIDKVGGLDNYLLSDKTARVKELGPMGWHLRHRVLETPLVQKRREEERVALGLVEEKVEEETGAADGKKPREVRWWKFKGKNAKGEVQKAEAGTIEPGTVETLTPGTVDEAGKLVL